MTTPAAVAIGREFTARLLPCLQHPALRELLTPEGRRWVAAYLRDLYALLDRLVERHLIPGQTCRGWWDTATGPLVALSAVGRQAAYSFFHDELVRSVRRLLTEVHGFRGPLPADGHEAYVVLEYFYRHRHTRRAQDQLRRLQPAMRQWLHRHLNGAESLG